MGGNLDQFQTAVVFNQELARKNEADNMTIFPISYPLEDASLFQAKMAPDLDELILIVIAAHITLKNFGLGVGLVAKMMDNFQASFAFERFGR